jgi:DNA-binding transcriptional ArsR family regulator
VTDRAERSDRESGNRLNPVKITDPKALRALAHPARITILQHLMLDGPATATECAEVAKLSPSACSYHLRALARYGFVEEEPAGGADGRHRPWRATAVGLAIGGDTAQPQAVRVAGRMLLEAVQAHLDERRAEYLDREAEYSEDWQLAAGANQDVVHVTPAELTELRAEIGELIDDYRRLRPEDRPPQSRRVGAVLEFTPWFAPDAQDDA